jgi:hypothetical protein
MSAHPPKADIREPGLHVRYVPILLQNSFGGGERKFLEPLTRLTRGDVGDRIVLSEIDHGPS